MLITNAYFVCIFDLILENSVSFIIFGTNSEHKWQIKHHFFSKSKLWLLWCFNTTYLFFWHICADLSVFLLLSLSLLKASLNLEMVRKLIVLWLWIFLFWLCHRKLYHECGPCMSGLKAADERLVYVPDGCHSFSVFLSLSSSAPPPTHTCHYHQ